MKDFRPIKIFLKKNQKFIFWNMPFKGNKTHLFDTNAICQLELFAFLEMCSIRYKFIFKKSLRIPKSRFIFASAIETQAIIFKRN
jgi:hypothetical protein